TPKQTTELSAKLEELNKRLNDVNRKLNGNASLSNREFETPPSIVARIRYITGSLWNTTAAQTQTQKDSYRIAAKEFKPVYAELRAIAEEINKAEGTLEKNNAPYTPGRIPEWREE
ncbi:MAG: glycosyl hydrolase, partial [Candidatus Nephrothrix sp. EaCA]